MAFVRVCVVRAQGSISLGRMSCRAQILGLLCLAAALRLPAQTITEFSIPSGNSPFDLAAGPDGNLWFTEAQGNRVGRITPQGVITEFTIPTAGSFPGGITAGPDGNLWVCANGSNKILRVTPAGGFTEFPIPNAFPSGGPSSITAGPDGALWFSETDGGVGGRIRRVTTSGQFTLFPGPNPSQSPHQIVAGPDGNLWYSMPISGKVGRVTAAGVITEFPLASPAANALALAPGPDGAVWIAESLAAGNKLGRIAPDGSMTELSMPAIHGGMFGLATGPDGALWFTETDAGRIGRMTIAGAVTDSAIPTSLSSPFAIKAGPDGAMWFAESDGRKIGRLVFAPFTCAADASTLCLSNSRFRVTAAWRSPTASGVAHAVSLTGDTGYFWFFDAGNVEAILKVLNACGLNSRYWVFGSGLTNVEVTLRVTDTNNGVTKTYVNPFNTAFQPVQDTDAFATCP